MTADELLAGRSPGRIADVLALMRALEAALPPGRRAWFLRLYRPVAIWKVSEARETAWANAEALWTPRGAPAVSRRRSTDSSAARGALTFSSRGRAHRSADLT